MKLASIFGDLASSRNLQLLVDSSLSMFNVPTWKKYFAWGNPTISIDFSTVIGKARIEAMASVVDRDAPAPLRSRQGLEKLAGQVPAIKEKFKLSERDYREYMALRALQAGGGNVNAQLDLIFSDMRVAGNSAHKRLDSMVYQALSSGAIQLSTTNNPDGIVTGSIDLLMPAANKYKTQTAGWSTTVGSDPIRDIEKIVVDFEAKGIRFEKMLMNRATFSQLRLSVEGQKYLAAYMFAGNSSATNKKFLGNLVQWNEYFIGEGLPYVELVESTSGIEKDGIITSNDNWTAGAVTFVPAGPLGIIHNALCIEQIQPVQSVAYASFDRALLSKWHENDPFAEYTQVELNAFPGWETIDRCVILDTTADPS
jgi:hypothetical protein